MLLETLRTDRALTVVRAPRLPDPASLCAALVAGGIRTVELTFTTPGIAEVLRTAVAATDAHGALVGAGTVTDERRAEAAIEAGARFLVTPGLHEGVARLAREAEVPFLLGATTPSEVMRAVELGCNAVKIFPASLVGPKYLGDLRGPFPELEAVPSGGLTSANAGEWIAAGALAVTAGSSVVSADLIDASDWTGIAERARAFRDAAHGAIQA